MILTCSLGTYAQKGMQGVGVNVGYTGGDYGEGPSVGLKYQYNITDYLRIEPTVTIVFCEFSSPKYALVDVDYFFMNQGRIRPYLCVGLGMTPTHHSYHEDSNFGGQAGFGLDWRVTHNISFGLKGTVIKCLSDESEGGYNICCGFSYNF